MTAPLDAAVVRLERRLAGSRRVRRDIVAEVRDGLVDAAAAHRDAGLAPAEAERRALEEFGDLDAVADELQQELATRQARGTALVLALAFLPLVVAWDMVWRFAPRHGAAGDEPIAIYATVDLVQIAAALAGAALALALARPGVRPWVVRAAGALGVATSLIVGSLAAAMLAYGPWSTGPALSSPIVAALSVASGATLVGSLLMGGRSLRLSAGRPRAASGR